MAVQQGLGVVAVVQLLNKKSRLFFCEKALCI